MFDFFSQKFKKQKRMAFEKPETYLRECVKRYANYYGRTTAIRADIAELIKSQPLRTEAFTKVDDPFYKNALTRHQLSLEQWLRNYKVMVGLYNRSFDDFNTFLESFSQELLSAQPDDMEYFQTLQKAMQREKRDLENNYYYFEVERELQKVLKTLDALQSNNTNVFLGEQNTRNSL